MTTFYTRYTPDYSPLLVHLTAQRKMMMPALIGDGHPLAEHRDTTPKEKLISILLARTIYASPMPVLPHNAHAVCFTECTWEGLVALSTNYSSYGIVFSKDVVYQRHGGPALCVRGDDMKTLWDRFPEELEPFVAPFDPDALLEKGVPRDWLHEREWRLPGDFAFEYSEVEYVIVDTIQDAMDVSQAVVDIPLRRCISMDVYSTITDAWRKH